MLELRSINTYYGNIQALHDVSLTIKEGEIITLIGANGAGKSTTLMSISGIVPPRTGEILFHGQPIQDLSPDRIVALGICQVPEGRHIFPDLTVAENLDMGAFLRNDKQQIEEDLDYIYSLFPILRDRRNQPGGNLSGGEQQMLAISRALMARPSSCCWTSLPWDWRRWSPGRYLKLSRRSTGKTTQPFSWLNRTQTWRLRPPTGATCWKPVV